MALDMNDESIRCYRCRKLYDKRRGNFLKSYAPLYKGTGYIHICRECVGSIYNIYLKACDNPALATRQVCRKLDLYWNDGIFNTVEKKSTSQNVVFQYISRIAGISSCAGKCYDDTLIAEELLWNFPGNQSDENQNNTTLHSSDLEDEPNVIDEVGEDIVAFWGSGYTAEMYRELEERKEYWMSRLPGSDDLDIGAEAYIRQICGLELDINKLRALGKSTDKQVTTLNALLGSMNMKPTQRRNEDLENDINTTPMGVWLYRYENKRPLPEIDDQLKDVNGVKRYVFTWMGHLCKMMGVENGYTKMYEKEVERLRVLKPEYDGDEEGLIIESYSDVHGE